ncbi:MAG: hypothetical protein EXX96DRAFT_480407 [Benjaminiella poitrasii]|nr:MAG: hypothetical protein EXX96DRAFT_480407 [Benjaminiella poitrasii]
MGFECHMYILRQVEDFYILETVDYITFPLAYMVIKENGEGKMAVRVMVWPSKEDTEETEEEDEDAKDENEEVNGEEHVGGEEYLTCIQY